MKLDRKEILAALETITIAGEGKNMVESGAVKNVLTFGNEVVVELVIATPAMHIKKRAEDDIKKPCNFCTWDFVVLSSCEYQFVSTNVIRFVYCSTWILIAANRCKSLSDCFGANNDRLAATNHGGRN